MLCLVRQVVVKRKGLLVARIIDLFLIKVDAGVDENVSGST